MDRLLEFAINHPLLVSGAVLLAIVTLANEVRLATRRGIDLSPQDAVALMNRGAAVIDIRDFERFKGGHIINAKHVPMDDLKDQATKKLASFKDKAVVVYDDNGTLGARAVNVLRSLDFQNAVSLKGGIGAWVRENFPVEKGK
jgi:rhodanese-related sulfurtransferase